MDIPFFRKPRSDVISLGRHLAKIHTVRAEKGYVIQGGNYHITDDQFYRHTLVQGTTGSGKTTLLENIIKQLLAKGSKVVVVDGAGGEQFAKNICVMGKEANLPPTPVVRYGWGDSSAVFNGFKGDNQAIYDRLVSLLALEDFRDNADFYRKHKREILSHICGLNMDDEYGIAPFDAPRSFDDAIGRINFTWWAGKFGGVDRAMNIWDANKEHANELLTDISVTVRPFRKILGEEGFQLGDHPLTVFSISRAGGGTSAEALFRYLGTTFSDAMRAMEKTVWIIDEVGLFGSRTVAQFVIVGRQFRLGLVMSYQSTASLGDDQYAKEVLDTTNTHILMRSNESHEMRSRAGFTETQDRRHTYYDKGKSESVGSRRVEKILHDDVNSLSTGEMFVIIGGDVSKVRGGKVELRTPFRRSMEAVYVRRPSSPSTQVDHSEPPNSEGNPELSPF